MPFHLSLTARQFLGQRVPPTHRVMSPTGLLPPGESEQIPLFVLTHPLSFYICVFLHCARIWGQGWEWPLSSFCEFTGVSPTLGSGFHPLV